MRPSQCVCVCAFARGPPARPALPPTPLLFPASAAGRDRHQGGVAAIQQRPHQPAQSPCGSSETEELGTLTGRVRRAGVLWGTASQRARAATELCGREVAPSAGHSPAGSPAGSPEAVGAAGLAPGAIGAAGGGVGPGSTPAPGPHRPAERAPCPSEPALSRRRGAEHYCSGGGG